MGELILKVKICLYRLLIPFYFAICLYSLENMLAETIDEDSERFVRSFGFDDDMNTKYRKLCALREQQVWTEFATDMLKELSRM